MADFSPADGAMISGIVIGVGYLLVFPFWMIRKLTRIEYRVKHLQSDIKEQDDVLQSFDRRIEEFDIALEERRKEIIKMFQSQTPEPPDSNVEHQPSDKPEIN
jgi:hypothetical protein